MFIKKARGPIKSNKNENQCRDQAQTDSISLADNLSKLHPFKSYWNMTDYDWTRMASMGTTYPESTTTDNADLNAKNGHNWHSLRMEVIQYVYVDTQQDSANEKILVQQKWIGIDSGIFQIHTLVILIKTIITLNF